MNKQQFIIILLALLPTAAFSAETVAKVKTSEWSVSVVSEGVSWENSCKLKLKLGDEKTKKEISLKRQETNCLLRGPVHLQAAEDAADHQNVTVFLEAERGDDSYHTGPVVEVFRLTNTGIKKLGEQVLFDATYHRKHEQITHVTGNVLFSLCQTCEYPESTNPEENIYVPVKLTAKGTNIAVVPTLSARERKELSGRFESQAKAAAKDAESESDFPKFVSGLRKQLQSLLKRQD
jgi:hypothetical protein